MRDTPGEKPVWRFFHRGSPQPRLPCAGAETHWHPWAQVWGRGLWVRVEVPECIHCENSPRCMIEICTFCQMRAPTCSHTCFNQHLS